LVLFGATWKSPMSTDRPISIVPSRAPSATSVRWARLAHGLRKVGTALATMASTPVSVLQPDAKALSSSRMPTPDAALAAGCARISPTTITAKITSLTGSM
jgi:hypothetical protein